MRRRHFLQAAAAGAVSALSSFRSASAQMRRMPGAAMGARTPRSWLTGSGWPTGLPLRRLGILEDTSLAADEFEGRLVAAPFNAATIFGRTTELWGYNNAFPGPVIELREGQRVTIDFANRLGLDSQQRNRNRLELGRKDLEVGARGDVQDLVRTVAFQASLGLRSGQARRIGIDCAHKRLQRLRMMVGSGPLCRHRRGYLRRRCLRAMRGRGRSLLRRGSTGPASGPSNGGLRLARR